MNRKSGVQRVPRIWPKIEGEITYIRTWYVSMVHNVRILVLKRQ
jgi:hypothetical protein